MSVILSIRAPIGSKPPSHHLVLDRVFWIERTVAPWRNSSGEFGKWWSA